MAQCTYEANDLPESGIEANAAFARDHLDKARACLGEADNLVIILLPAAPDHTDWRRALARDLARAHTPKRVNVVAGQAGEALDATLSYLDGAKGVTGHYLETHE